MKASFDARFLHLSADTVVLPKVIAAGNQAYRACCAACSFADDGKSAMIIPYAVFYEEKSYSSAGGFLYLGFFRSTLGMITLAGGTMPTRSLASFRTSFFWSKISFFGIVWSRFASV